MQSLDEELHGPLEGLSFAVGGFVLCFVEGEALGVEFEIAER
jgi:hypothetical protein